MQFQRAAGSEERQRNIDFSGLSAGAVSRNCAALAMPAQIERPVRGDNRTGQAIWALGGGWALAPNTASWGGFSAPTRISRRRGRARSTLPANFLTSWQGFRRGQLLRRRAIGLADGRFAGRHCRRSRDLGSGRGNLLPVRRFFDRAGIRSNRQGLGG
jgi:hypothetical protein